MYSYKLLKRVTIFIATLLFFSCSSKLIITPGYLNNNPQADGLQTEWNDTLMQKSKTPILYSIGYNENYIFLILKITESDIQQKIIQKGLTLWIDSTNTKKKYYGLHYPKESDFAQIQMYSFNDNTNYFELFNTQYSSGMQFVEILSMPNDDQPQIGYTKQNNGLSISVQYNTVQHLIYEVTIPKTNISKNLTNQQFSIGIETGHFESNQKTEEFDLSQSNSNYSTQNYNSNNPIQPVDYSSITNTDYNSLNQPTKFWIKNIQFPK